MMNYWDMVLMGFIFGLLGASCYCFVTQIIKVYKLLLKKDG